MAKKASKLITIGGPLGLIAGFALGNLAHHGSVVAKAQPFIEPLGKMWMNGLRVAVVPLTVCLLVCGVCSLPRGKALGNWGARTLAWIVGFLLLGALFTVPATKLYFSISPPQKLEIAKTSPAPQEKAETDWVTQFVPTNIVDSAAKGDILPLAIFSVLFGLALRTLSEERRKPVESFFAGVRDAVLTFVHCLILAIPIGAFALAFTFATESGLQAATTLVQFTVYIWVLTLVALLVVLVATFISVRRPFSHTLAAVSPLISVAVGTRSSLASLPTLVESAKQLDLPDPASDIVLPTTVTIFKANRTISATGKVLFVAAAIGLVVPTQTLLVFIGTIVLLSFATPGLPSGANNSSWGAYMAAGLPIEAIVLFEVTDGITDIVKTAFNVASDFAVAVLVSRGISQTQTDTSSTALAASEEPAC